MALSAGGVDLVVCCTVFSVLAIIAVALRVWARSLKKSRLQLTDYLIIIGLVLTLATACLGFALAIDGGAGRHITEITSVNQIETLLKLFIAAPVVWGFATTCVKLSILTFYYDIFATPRFRRVVYVMCAIVVALCLATILEPFLLCRPLSYTWTRVTMMTKGTCGDSQKAYLGVAVVNLLVDLAILGLPMPMLWQLQMPFQKKLGITVILALGLIVCIFSALRIWAVLHLSETDFSYTVIDDTIFGGLEIQLGIVNACLPFYQPVAKQLFGSSSVWSTIFSRKRTKASTEQSSGWQQYSDNTPLQSANDKKGRFHRLKDSYQLDDITTNTKISTASDLEGAEGAPDAIAMHRSVDVYKSNESP